MIVKKPAKKYLLRVINSNQYILFLFIVILISGLLQLKFIQGLIILLPLIIKAIINSTTVAKYNIEEIEFKELSIIIKYDSYFTKKSIEIFYVDLILEIRCPLPQPMSNILNFCLLKGFRNLFSSRYLYLFPGCRS